MQSYALAVTFHEGRIEGRVIIDTGSGVHVVGRQSIADQDIGFKYKACVPIQLNTANGSILSKIGLMYNSPILTK